MEPRAVDFRTIGLEMLRLARMLPVPLTLYILCTTAAYAFHEWHYGDDFTMVGTLIMLVDGYLVYVLIFLLMAEAGLFAQGKRGGFLAYLVFTVLGGLAIIFGFLLLIVPGLVLMARWMPGVCDVLVRNDGAVQAMKQSWEATGRATGALMLHAAGAFLLGVASGAVWAMPASLWGSAPLAFAILANLLAVLASVWLILLAVASYRLLMAPAAKDAAVQSPA